MTINEVVKNMDVEEFLKQKEWLNRQIAELSPSGAELYKNFEHYLRRHPDFYKFYKEL